MSFASTSRRSLCPLLVAAILAAIPVVSQAAIVTEGPTSFGAFAAGASGNFNVPQFDPSLGTLLSVELFLTGNSDGGFNKVENGSANPGNANASIGTNISVTGPAALTALAFPATSGSGAIAAFDGTIDWAPSSDLLAVFGAPSTDSDSDILTSGMGGYIGLGNVVFSYSSSVNTASGADVSPTFAATSPPTFDFEVTVKYTYEPAVVPEPGTLALFAVGLVGLGRLARRRRSA